MIRGDAQDVEGFLKLLNGEDYFVGVESSLAFSPDVEWDGTRIVGIEGTCKWSLASTVTKKEGISFADKLCSFGLTAEYWTEELGVGFQEHVYIQNGQLLIDKEYDVQDWALELWDSLEEANEDMVSWGEEPFSEEEWNEGRGTDGYDIRRGGSPSFMSFFDNVFNLETNMAVEVDTYYLAGSRVVMAEFDDMCESPREWGAESKFYTWLRGFESPDSYDGGFDSFCEDWGVEPEYDVKRDLLAVVEKINESGGVAFPVSLYGHSGLEYYMGMPEDHFDGRWDCSPAGVIYLETDYVESLPGGRVAAKCLLQNELRDYNRYCNGKYLRVDCYEIKNGTVVDSFSGVEPENLTEVIAEIASDTLYCKMSDHRAIVQTLGQYTDIYSCLKQNESKLENVQREQKGKAR